MYIPLADGAKRRARVLIPPAIYTRETKALAKLKVHQISRVWHTNDVSVGGHPH